MSVFGVVLLFLTKQCTTTIVVPFLSTYMVRNWLLRSRARNSRTPGPTVLISLESKGDSPYLKAAKITAKVDSNGLWKTAQNFERIAQPDNVFFVLAHH